MTSRLALLAGAAAGLHAAPVVTRVSLMGRLWPGTAGLGPRGRVALTFDDGPDGSSTPAVLDLLRRRGVRATFFQLGVMVQRFPGLPRQMVDEGHELAVHGWDHRGHLLRVPGRSTTGQLERTADLLEARCGVRPSLFRPPYGLMTAGDLLAARRLGLRPVLWTSWGKDWSAHATPRSVVSTALRGQLDGGTILLHDSDCTSAPGSWRSTLGALPDLLDELDRRGLQVGPVTTSP